MFLLTEQEGRMRKYLARVHAQGLYAMIECQIFSRLAQPNSVNIKYFTKLPFFVYIVV